MASAQIVINGCGILGRSLIRDLYTNIVAIIDPKMSVEEVAYLLKYDSISSQFTEYKNLNISTDSSSSTSLTIDGKIIPFYTQEITADATCPSEVSGAYFIECTGTWTPSTNQIASVASAAKIILAYDYGDTSVPYVTLANLNTVTAETQTYQLGDIHLNPMSCVDTLIIDNNLMSGDFIRHTIITGATNAQKVQDAASSSDYARGRSAMINIIPLNTNSGKYVGKIIPVLNGKVTSSELRVPLATGCILKTAFVPAESSKDSINVILKKAADAKELIAAYFEDAITSSDIPYHFYDGMPAALALRTYYDTTLAEITVAYDPIWCLVYDVEKVIEKCASVSA